MDSRRVRHERQGAIHTVHQINGQSAAEAMNGATEMAERENSEDPNPPPLYHTIDNVRMDQNGRSNEVVIDPRRLSVADLAPHMDHYRNLISISKNGDRQAARPSLAELHLRIDDLPEPLGSHEPTAVSPFFTLASK